MHIHSIGPHTDRTHTLTHTRAYAHSHVHTHTHTYTRARAHTHMHIHTHTHTRTHAHTHIHTHTHAHAHTHTKKESYYFGSCSPSANKLICDAGNGTRLRGILLQILTAQRSELDSDHIGSPRYAGRWLCWRDGISIIAVEVIYVSVCTCGEQRVV